MPLNKKIPRTTHYANRWFFGISRIGLIIKLGGCDLSGRQDRQIKISTKKNLKIC